MLCWRCKVRIQEVGFRFRWRRDFILGGAQVTRLDKKEFHAWLLFSHLHAKFLRGMLLEEVNGLRNNSHGCFTLLANSLLWFESEFKRESASTSLEGTGRAGRWLLAAKRRWTELLGGEQEFSFSFINYQNFFARVFYSNKDFWSLLKFAYMINSISQSFIYTRLFR